VLVVPPLGLPGQVHAATRDDAGLLVECSIQCHGVVPLTIVHLVGHLHGVLRSLADEGVVGNEEDSAFDILWLELQHIVEKFHPLGIVDVPQPLLEGLCLDVVQGQEGLWLQHLVLQVLDALSRRALSVHHDGLHVPSKLLGDRHIVLLVDGLRHVDHPVIHARVQALEILHNLLLLLPPVVLVLVNPGVSQLGGHLLQALRELLDPVLAGANVPVQLVVDLLLLVQLSLAGPDVVLQLV